MALRTRSSSFCGFGSPVVFTLSMTPNDATLEPSSQPTETTRQDLEVFLEIRDCWRYSSDFSGRIGLGPTRALSLLGFASFQGRLALNTDYKHGDHHWPKTPNEAPHVDLFPHDISLDIEIASAKDPRLLKFVLRVQYNRDARKTSDEHAELVRRLTST